MLKYLKHKPILAVLIAVLVIAVLAATTLGILRITKPSDKLPPASEESSSAESLPQASTTSTGSGDPVASQTESSVSSSSVTESAVENKSAASTDTPATTVKTTKKPTTTAAAKATTKPQPATATTSSPTSAFSDFQARVIALVNTERTSRGLNALSGNTSLSDVATRKSQDMADLGYFDHTSPTYGSPFDMMKQFGIHYTTAGENIAMGQTTPEQVMNGWMNSEGHRANILNAAFTQIGVGIAKNADGRLYWTQMFIG